MKYSGFDFERMGKVMEQEVKVERPLPMPLGYPYPKLAAIPDLVDGYPACWWFEYPERLKHLNIDQKGMGIRAEGLPDALRPFSLNGWIVKLVDGKLEIFAGRNGVSNEQIIRAYMEDCRDKIIEALGEVGGTKP